MPKLCSFGCSPSGVTMHRFPNPDKFPERFKSWVDFVGGKLEMESDFEYYHKKVICDKHFTVQDRTRNNRLHGMAVPTVKPHDESADDRPQSLSSQPSLSHVFKTEESADDTDTSRVNLPLLAEKTVSKTNYTLRPVQPEKLYDKKKIIQIRRRIPKIRSTNTSLRKCENQQVTISLSCASLKLGSEINVVCNMCSKQHQLKVVRTTTIEN